MIAYTINSKMLRNNIYIPKYYDPDLQNEINSLSKTHDLLKVCDLIDGGVLSAQTGDEIGKMAYGTGNIPFVRTSDISNWEIKTIPKQGVSEEIYQQYAEKEDVRPGDILLVRDGTYLIGTNCMITELDVPMVFQSHILKLRVLNPEKLDPALLFLSINSALVQRQIKSMQFTADIIDTLGSRYREIILPIPKDTTKKEKLANVTKETIAERTKFKAAIKQMPVLIEQVLAQNSTKPIEDFLLKSVDAIIGELVQDTTTLEFGEFSAFDIGSSKIVDDIFLPKYYDPSVRETLDRLSLNCDLYSIRSLVEKGELELSTGDEIGKMAYGTGNIPFVRTSDFSNWEIKTDAKQGISEDIYEQYSRKEDVKAEDILIVRDGTYLVGTSCMISSSDEKMLYCGGLIKIRCVLRKTIDPYLLLGLLNSYIVKKQIRSKQFTRDVIDTLGQRFSEVILPVPKDKTIRAEISKEVKNILECRIKSRDKILDLSNKILH